MSLTNIADVRRPGEAIYIKTLPTDHLGLWLTFVGVVLAAAIAAGAAIVGIAWQLRHSRHLTDLADRRRVINTAVRQTSESVVMLDLITTVSEKYREILKVSAAGGADVADAPVQVLQSRAARLTELMDKLFLETAAAQAALASYFPPTDPLCKAFNAAIGAAQRYSVAIEAGDDASAAKNELIRLSTDVYRVAREPIDSK